ncbi:MAG TPA: NAD(+) synthase [Longimicrobiaceae bacterium]|nr:NAD(+) synthase [Longimicrobiaceae bacterium]
MQKSRDPRALVEGLTGWIREHVERAGATGAVFGLSGGIDSAVACGLCARAMGPERCLGVVMPIGNVPEDEELGRLTGERFGVRVIAPDLLPAFQALEEAFRAERDATGLEPTSPEAAVLATANVKPRLRMTTLYHFASLLNYLVVGTGNKAELTVGYFTKYGDSGVDLLPLADLTKTEVRAVARELSVPERIVERAPSAGLWEGQTDEEELGITYEQIDRYLEEGSSGSAEADARIRRRFLASQHKRELPPAALLA